MKTLCKNLIYLLFFISITNTYGQFTTSGNNVVFTNPGPTTSGTTNLYLSNTISSSTTSYPTVLTIDNSTSNPSGPVSHTSQLSFSSSGTAVYNMFYSTFPNCGSGMFHIAPSGTGAGIHMSGSQIAFSNSSQGGGCGNNFGVGKYIFDGVIGSAFGINLGYDGQVLHPPSGYTLTNSGPSYFKDKVLIGTTSTTIPTSAYKLYVGGTAICEELVVKLQANWPDFVFAPDYKLKPLGEVKSYITKNSHLPDVPTACEVEEKGVATGEMLTIQMKKIEELTLYLIQMQEQNEAIQKTNAALLKRIEVLESK